MPDSPRADVIIVGAGPAGSTAAMLLARRGLDVLLLDRAAFPRPKPCGDCLSAATTQLLDRLGLLARVRAAGASEIDHWQIVAPDGTPAIGRFRAATALALERRRLDPVLLDAAIAAGARFQQLHVTDLVECNGRVVGVRGRDGGSSGSALYAPLVVGADGLRSIVARRLDVIRGAPKLRKVSLTAHLPAPAAPMRHGEMHLIPHGCIGYAPAGIGLCNLTLVLETDAAGPLAELGPGRFFRRQLEHTPDLAARLRGVLGDDDALPDTGLLASGPFDVPTRTAAARGAALVGDAAGYFDPFTGQGIYQAMAAAERLAEELGPVLENRPPSAGELDAALRRYARARRRLSAPARAVQRGVERVLSRPWLANRVLGRLAAAPAAMDRLVEVTGDLRAPLSLLSPAVVSSFIVPRAGDVT